MQEQQANRRKAIIFAVVLHVLLAAVLVLGIEFSDYRPLSGPKVEIIEAELVSTPVKPRVDPVAERLKQELEDKQRQEAEEAKRRQEIETQERRLKTEEQRKQAEVLKQQKFEQQKQVEALARQQQEAEKKRKAEQAAILKAETEASKKAEAEARKKTEEVARQKKAQEEADRKAKAEQAAREQALLDAMAQEERERELKPLEAAYIAAISQQIARNWLKPPGISDTLKCKALVIQIPDGTVTSANITTSSGDAVFDESVIKAIYKASPLPQPPSPEVFDRELRIAFCSTGNVCE